jgi:hypothetical protein
LTEIPKRRRPFGSAGAIGLAFSPDVCEALPVDPEGLVVSDSNTAMRALTREVTFLPRTDTRLDEGGEGNPCFLFISAMNKSFEDSKRIIIVSITAKKSGVINRRGGCVKRRWRGKGDVVQTTVYIYGIVELRTPRHHDTYSTDICVENQVEIFNTSNPREVSGNTR